MSLRVSNIGMTGSYQSQLQGTYSEYTSIFEQSDGSKLHRSSDNSVDYSKYLRYQNSLTNNNQYQSNVTTALSWMNTSDSVLTNVVSSLNTFNSKVIQAANSSNNESDLQDIAKELLANVQAIVQDLNTQSGDRYIFSGQSDTTMPFTISEEKYDRGLTKTLDATEKNYFTNANETGSMSQMLVLNGTDGETYYLNTSDNKVYTKEFVDEGYKTQISAGYTNVQTGDEVATLSTAVDISDNFETNGVIKGTKGDNSGLGADWSATIQVDGQNVDLSFATVSQYIVEYNGDDKYISMVSTSGTTRPQTDSVNVTGQDIFGSDIFDTDATHQSGTAMLNELLTVVAQIDDADYHWASSDGTTVAETGVDVVLAAQTKLAARNQAYQATQTMLTTQNESITSDISDVASTDVAELAVKLMQYQQIYSLSLSVGARILPTTLSDYI